MGLRRSKRHRMLFVLFGIAALSFTISSCATQPATNSYDPPGFFSGLLHGFLIVFSFIGSLFTNVRIYSFPNSGVWYDFGYLLGAMMFLGGAGSQSRRGNEEASDADDDEEADIP